MPEDVQVRGHRNFSQRQLKSFKAAGCGVKDDPVQRGALEAERMDNARWTMLPHVKMMREERLATWQS